MSITKPFSFVAGTKARANEVNEDFDSLYSQVNTNSSEISEIDLRIQDLDDTKAELNGNASQRFAVADAINGADAINKNTYKKLSANVVKIIDGLRILKDSSSPKDTIIVTAGNCIDSTGEVPIRIAEDTSKKNDPQASNTTYFVHVITNKAGTISSILISPEQVEPPLPIDYHKYRCIGYFETDNNGNISYIKEFSNSVIRMFVPDYTKGIGFGDGFVAPSVGLITMSGEISNAAWWVQVNGRNVILVGDNATGSTYNQVVLILNRGDRVTGTFGNRLFFPMKGAN